MSLDQLAALELPSAYHWPDPAAARNLTIELFNTPGPPAGQSEDCLYIDVYAPASGKGKAVLFWIYGGGLQFGSNSVWAYNGTSFAANQDVIVAIPNYRTNGVWPPSCSLSG